MSQQIPVARKYWWGRKLQSQERQKGKLKERVAFPSCILHTLYGFLFLPWGLGTQKSSHAWRHLICAYIRYCTLFNMDNAKPHQGMLRWHLFKGNAFWFAAFSRVILSSFLFNLLMSRFINVIRLCLLNFVGIQQKQNCCYDLKYHF